KGGRAISSWCMARPRRLRPCRKCWLPTGSRTCITRPGAARWNCKLGSLAGANQGAEQVLHARVVGQALRVPLHTDGEGMLWELDGLNQAVGGAGAGPQGGAQVFDAPVGHAVDRD